MFSAPELRLGDDLTELISHYHEDRTNLGLGKETPARRRGKRIQRLIVQSLRSRDWSA
jgi:hypothetical protein